MLALLFLAEFGSGFGVMLLDISVGSIIAALVPDRLRARVSGAYMRRQLRRAAARRARRRRCSARAIGVRPTLWIAALGAIAGFLFLLPSPILRCASCPSRTSDLSGASASVSV